MPGVEKLNRRVELSQRAKRQDSDDSQRRSKLRALVTWKMKLHDQSIKIRRHVDSGFDYDLRNISVNRGI
jgi:CHASE3 domain sensor protein